MWCRLTFSNHSYELAYMRYTQLAAPSTCPLLLLRGVATALALAKQLLQCCAGGTPCWRALSCVLFLACLGACQLAAALSARVGGKPQSAALRERHVLRHEVAALFATFWWLCVFRPTELLPCHTPFSALAFRGYLLACDQVRLASAFPLLLLEAAAFGWLQAARGPPDSGLAAAARFVLLGLIVPLACMAHGEARQRWRFIQHQRLDVSGLGPWPALIDGASLAAAAVCRLRARCAARAAAWRRQALRLALLGAVCAAGAAIAAGARWNA